MIQVYITHQDLVNAGGFNILEQWCNNNIGSQDSFGGLHEIEPNTWKQHYTHGGRIFYFYEDINATMFVLKWCNSVINM